MRTAWGESISYGWEFECDNHAIWDWFEDPDAPLATFQRWRAVMSSGSVDDRVEWFDQLVRRSGCPRYIDNITYETHRVCELNSQPTRFPVWIANQMREVHDKLAPTADYSAFQVHIVFRLPPVQSLPGSLDRHGRIAALFHLLNDFTWAKSASLDPNEHYRVFTGPATRKVDRLADRLRLMAPQAPNGPSGLAPDQTSRSNSLDGRASQDKPKYKNVNVGLRDLYDDSDPATVGFEIRKGVHSSLSELMRCVTIITDALVSDLGTIKLYPPLVGDHNAFTDRTSGPLLLTTGQSYSLEEHYHFTQRAPVLEAHFVAQLRQEASQVILGGGRISEMGHLNKQGQDDGKELWRRWLLALKPWDFHPALANDPHGAATIQLRRAALQRDLELYLRRSESDRARVRFSEAHQHPAPKLDYVSLKVQSFLNAIKLQIHL